MTAAKTKPGNTRVTGKEQFYTPPVTALEVVTTVSEFLQSPKSQPWLEPSAGTGAFIEALRKSGFTEITATDIEPHHEAITKVDFLTWQSKQKNFVTIGNPPFGRNNALSVPFFNHAANFSNAIAFIVPRSWRKWSVTNRLDMRFHKVLDQDLSINYLDALGNDKYRGAHLQTCLQIWRLGSQPRTRVVVNDNGFVSRAKPADADIAMRAFGYGCGRIETNFPRVANTTMLFLKVNDKRVLPALKKIDFTHYSRNVSYTQALGLAEINHALNKQLLGHYDTLGDDYLA